MKYPVPEIGKTSIGCNLISKYAKKLFKGFFPFALLPLVLASDAQTLGNYPNATVVSGQNTTVTPGAAPTNTTSVVAYTNTNFTGIFSVNPSTGVITITNAKQAGSFPVIVKAFGPSPITSTFTLTVTNPVCSQGLFLEPKSVSVGTNPYCVAVGDFNRDGKQDIATANYGGNTVSIRLGDGTGSFSGTRNVSVGNGPHGVTVGDFNGDGKQDFASANENGNTVSIRLGNGAGAFTGNTEVNTGSGPNSIIIGDFNIDGKQDLATANRYDNSVSILLGDGIGNLIESARIGVGISPISIAIGDFNEDGKQDFATANNNPKGSVSVRFGDGAGGFTGTTEVGAGYYHFSVAVGDFNKDGFQDLAANKGGKIYIYLGDGTGSFIETNQINAGNWANCIAIGDFNGDGNEDFTTSNWSNTPGFPDYLTIRSGNGLGGFSGIAEIGIGTNHYSYVAVGDFNGDAFQDIAASKYYDNKISIFLGGGAEVNVQGNNIAIPDGDNSPATADNSDFGKVGIGLTLSQTFTIQNKGTTGLSISNISSSNALFEIGSAPDSIEAGSSATFTVTFSPTEPGAQNATITINNNDCDEAVYDFAITGMGIGDEVFTWYKDHDNDDYSDGATLVQALQPPGYKLAADLTATSGDCNDADADTNPAQTEICGNGKDDDCNPATSDVCTPPDADNDGVPDAEDCAHNDATKFQTANLYKDADNDGYDGGQENVCYGAAVPNGYKFTSHGLDCNDANSTVYPGATELCDGLDNDCDTQVDEGCPVGTFWYFDYDNDGFGNTDKPLSAITRPKGYVAIPGDCRDWDPLSYPGAPETGDGIDNNCNGLVDESLPCLKTWYYDGDGDGYGADAYTRLSCIQHNNYVPLGGDCKNWDANVYPGHGCPPITEPNTAQPKAMVEVVKEIQVFPNPASNELVITLNGFEAGKKLEIQMVMGEGKVVMGQSLTPINRSQQVRINVSRLSTGYYLLQIRQGALQQTKKVMIVR